MVLKTFVLVGVIVSHDELLSTVEFNTNPAVNGGPAIAVMQNSAIPCEVEVGKKIYVVKSDKMEHATISCEANNEGR